METEALIAVLQLGLPVAVLSWILLSRLYRAGELDPSRDADDMDDMLEELQQQREAADKKGGYIENKWLEFGGGFYGTTAFYTFVVVDIIDIKDFILGFPGWQKLASNGIVELAIDLFTNQITNFVTAMIWFKYWADEGHIGLWVLIAYLGYLLGMQAARRFAPKTS